MQNNLKNEKIWLVGFITDSIQSKPNLFVLIQTGEVDTPIMNNGKVIIFQKSSVIKYLYEKYEILLIGDELYQEIEITLNIGILIKKIKYCRVDRNSIIINSLNIFYDMTKHLHKNKKHDNVNLFYSFANHLTYENEFLESFIKKYGTNRIKLLDSIYWNFGLLMANSEII